MHLCAICICIPIFVVSPFMIEADRKSAWSTCHMLAVCDLGKQSHKLYRSQHRYKLELVQIYGIIELSATIDGVLEASTC